MNPIILSAKNIKKGFTSPTKVEVLNGIDLTLSRGECIAIAGKSGEGKSTLLHILGTLETPSEGSLSLCSLDASLPSNISKIRNEHLGFIFQNYNLLLEYTVLENVLLPAKIGRRSTKKNSPSYVRALALLEEVGLSDRIDFPAKLLSGGEKQRAAIARALCNNPALILADEPSGNLDQAHSSLIHSLLLGCAKKLNKGLIIVTHDKELASLCDTSYLLSNGALTCIS